VWDDLRRRKGCHFKEKHTHSQPHKPRNMKEIGGVGAPQDARGACYFTLLHSSFAPWVGYLEGPRGRPKLAQKGSNVESI